MKNLQCSIMYESLLYVNALNSGLCDAVHSAVFVCEYSVKIAIDILKSETLKHSLSWVDQCRGLFVQR